MRRTQDLKQSPRGLREEPPIMLRRAEQRRKEKL
jgi:hypothetical protein